MRMAPSMDRPTRPRAVQSCPSMEQHSDCRSPRVWMAHSTQARHACRAMKSFLHRGSELRTRPGIEYIGTAPGLLWGVQQINFRIPMFVGTGKVPIGFVAQSTQSSHFAQTSDGTTIVVDRKSTRLNSSHLGISYA